MPQLLITKFVPDHQHPDGHVFIKIFANVRIQKRTKDDEGALFLESGFPYTVCVSRRQDHSFNHGCSTIESAQRFLEQHRYDLELIAPAGKVRAYYADKDDHRYFYMGRSYRDEPHWRAEESRAAWLTPTEFDAVAEEAAKGTWTKDKVVLQHVYV
jgi:hypothetical protein